MRKRSASLRSKQSVITASRPRSWRRWRSTRAAMGQFGLLWQPTLFSPSNGSPRPRPAADLPAPLSCQPPEDKGKTNIVFKDHADSIDFAAGKLEKLEAYKLATETYKQAANNGNKRRSAATTWLNTKQRRCSFQTRRSGCAN